MSITPTLTATFPMRQVHLDFHTSPDIPDVGADWDAAHFAQTLTDARVNSITLFATCHHGMSYYPSQVAPVHPTLKLDLLGEQIEACHRAGIRCPIYLTVGWNVSAAQRHPEWRQVDINGKNVGAGPLDAGWPWLCVGTEYADELLAQTEELMASYDCDGFFYDIVMYHPDGCVNPPALASMRKLGLDPREPLDRRKHNHLLARRFMERTTNLIRAKLPDAGIFYNSRWGLHFADEQQYYSQVEVESLPTGGWGYSFYPYWSRYARQFPLPLLGMTGRFHRSWADWGGLKHPDALRFECGGILANGGAVSIGDQLHPRGKLNEAVYEVIGEAFRDVEKVEAYCIGAKAETEVGLLVLNPLADKANQSTAGIVSSSSENLEGAAKMLLELHCQFDVITDKVCSDFSRYKVLVVPDRAIATAEAVERLRQFVRDGGKLLLSHEALLENGRFLLEDEMGVTFAGYADSNPDYFQVDDALTGPVTRAGFAYCLYEGPTVQVKVGEGTQILADAYPTYFNRTGDHFTSHGFTCPTPNKADYPAVTERGGVIYVYGPIFTAYQRHGNLTFRALVGKLLERLLPDPQLSTDAPPSTEVTLTRQDTDGTPRYLAHVVNYSPQRRGSSHVEVLDAPIPLHNVRLTLRNSSVTRAHLARTGDVLPLTTDTGTATVTVPRAEAFEIVAFE